LECLYVLGVPQDIVRMNALHFVLIRVTLAHFVELILIVFVKSILRDAVVVESVLRVLCLLNRPISIAVFQSFKVWLILVDALVFLDLNPFPRDFPILEIVKRLA